MFWEYSRISTKSSCVAHAGCERTVQLPVYEGGPQGMRIPPILELYRLRRRQWQNAKVIETSQRKKLKKTIALAYRNIKYYAELFDNAGISPEDINSVGDLEAIPITERLAYQERPLSDVTARNVDLKKCRRILTSGSSGRPLSIYRSRSEDNLVDVTWAFAFLENGQRFWDRCADYHSFLGLPSRWFERLGIWRRTTIPSLAEPAEQIPLLKQLKPDVIRGNPDDLLNLVSTLRRDRVQGLNSRLVFTMGALLDRRSREIIESALGAKVFDYYGSTELGCIAWECSMQKGYHINTDSVVLEVVDPKGHQVRAGENGRLVCTGLIAHTMPFIRYDTGDIGALDDRTCPCGRTLPLLSRLEGRAYDFFVLRDGSEIPPTVILNRIKLVQGIQQYRVIQESITQVRVEIVPDRHWTEETGETVQALLKQITHGDAMINIEIVEKIRQDGAGKIQSIMSKVRHIS
jgi:phenylacetate-CoA ligase